MATVTLDEIREKARGWLEAHAGDLARGITLAWPAWFQPWVTEVGVRAAVPPSYWFGDLTDLRPVTGLPFEAYASFTVGQDVTVPLPEGAVRHSC